MVIIVLSTAGGKLLQKRSTTTAMTTVMLARTTQIARTGRMKMAMKNRMKRRGPDLMTWIAQKSRLW